MPLVNISSFVRIGQILFSLARFVISKYIKIDKNNEDRANLMRFNHEIALCTHVFQKGQHAISLYFKY